MTHPTPSLADSPLALQPEDLPNLDELVTEDDAPMDNLFSEKQQRLLTESLYSTWSGPGEGRKFLATANVGLFYSVRQPPLVPDMLLSLDVEPPTDLWEKRNRSYFIWEYGKPPEVVIEIVSNLKGHEAADKLRDYTRIGVVYYAIFDPLGLLSADRLRLYRHGLPEANNNFRLDDVGLELKLWRGIYEGSEQEWLRWIDSGGNLILTGAEQAQKTANRAERLAAQLRALGVQPQDE